MGSPTAPGVESPRTGIRVLDGAAAVARTDALRSVYADAFGAPPWNAPRLGPGPARSLAALPL